MVKSLITVRVMHIYLRTTLLHNVSDGTAILEMGFNTKKPPGGLQPPEVGAPGTYCFLPFPSLQASFKKPKSHLRRARTSGKGRPAERAQTLETGAQGPWAAGPHCPCLLHGCQ